MKVCTKLVLPTLLRTQLPFNSSRNLYSSFFPNLVRSSHALANNSTSFSSPTRTIPPAARRARLTLRKGWTRAATLSRFLVAACTPGVITRPVFPLPYTVFCAFDTDGELRLMTCYLLFFSSIVAQLKDVAIVFHFLTLHMQTSSLTCSSSLSLS